MRGIARVLSFMAVLALSAGGSELPNGLKIVNPYVCEPGANFKLDCNDCTCSTQPGTLAMCTLMACNLGPDECIPGSYFQVNETLCSCPDTGVKWDSNCFSHGK